MNGLSISYIHNKKWVCTSCRKSNFIQIIDLQWFIVHTTRNVVYYTQQITDLRSAPITWLLSLAPPSELFRSTQSDIVRTFIYCMLYSKNCYSVLHIAIYFICNQVFVLRMEHAVRVCFLSILLRYRTYRLIVFF